MSCTNNLTELQSGTEIYMSASIHSHKQYRQIPDLPELVRVSLLPTAQNQKCK